MLTNLISVQEGQRGLPALPSVPDIGLSGMPAIALPENPGELWAPLPAPNENNIFATRPAEAVKPYSSFYRALPTVTDSAIKPEAGRKLAQIQPNDPSKPAQPFGYRLVLGRFMHQYYIQFCEHAQQCLSSQSGYQTLVSCDLAAASCNNRGVELRAILCVASGCSPMCDLGDLQSLLSA